MVAYLLRHQTSARTKAKKAEIISISREEGGGRKLRFDVEATHGGPKIRCDQGNKLPVQRAPGARNRDHQRYLIHATEPEAASELTREGMRQIRNRQEFRILEPAYDGHQSKYI